MREVAGGRSPAELFSWKSPAFRRIGPDLESLSDDELVRLMLGEPRLIRRPLIRAGGELIVGADWEAIDRAFP